ncbi:MAG: OadG family protein [Bacteroidota bacterium]
MSNDLSTALLVLAVGMITVFAILSLVVIGGNTLIRIVNHFSAAEVPATPAARRAVPKQEAPKIRPATIAALAAVVETVTHGKGTIQKIEKF